MGTNVWCIIRTGVLLKKGGVIMEKYIGHTVDIVYIDLKKKISFRRVQVYTVHDGRIKAFCFDTKALRTFIVTNILSTDLVVQKVV